MTDQQRSYAPSQKAQRSRTTGSETLSRRRMSAGRKAWYAFLIALARGIARTIWSTCTVEKVIGAEYMDAAVEAGDPVLPCYWHQMHVYCARYMLDQLDRGMKVGFLISPSVSGEVPAAMAAKWGATVVRGSPTRTGGQALRDMYLTINRQGVSPVITVDGPKGPPRVAKNGAVLLARLTRAPMIPIAFAASSATLWNSWDRFMVPRPYSRIVIVVGEPLSVPAGTAIDDLEPFRQELEDRLEEVNRVAQAYFGRQADQVTPL
jgi:lysophospholipid acyltransferase (LPLAT)-like uncharacterized protein